MNIQVTTIEIKHCQLNNILIKIRQNLRGIIFIIIIISSKDDNDEERIMDSKIGNIEIIISDETEEIIEQFFNQLTKTDIKIIFNQ